MYRGREGFRTDLAFQRTLAADYVIDIEESSQTWRGYLIDDVLRKGNYSEGCKAVSTLCKEWDERPSIPSFTLVATMDDDKAAIILENNLANANPSLVAILSRLMIQWATKIRETKAASFELPSEEVFEIAHHITSHEFSFALFQSFLETTENIEFSEMVTHDGTILGRVPRSLVHQENLLHRGIGVLVTKDKPISVSQNLNGYPELYVHRRTDTKRIFPSLYDMFVGGVSIAGEDARLTAAREIAEELGLDRVLSDPSMLSDALFDCTICTSYNRCLVTVFFCTFVSDSRDSIKWQEEEVSWGDFVKYDLVVASADLSIDRLIKEKKWPGEIPVSMKERIESAKISIGEKSEWRKLDYVPDGLLVWEAWLDFQKKSILKD